MRFGSSLCRRVLVLICAVVLTMAVLLKSRLARDSRPPAAFPVSATEGRLVRIMGDVRHPGIYSVPANFMTIDAILMATPLEPRINELLGSEGSQPLESASTLHLTVSSAGTVQIQRGKLPVNERLILELPIDINDMTAADLDRLPGIGPSLAERIIAHRHKIGEFKSLDDLMALDGIGEKTLHRLKKQLQPTDITVE